MYKTTLKFEKIIICLIFALSMIMIDSNLFAKEKINFKQVEAIGRSVLLNENIETSRKRALEDALYIAALKGGATINGFSSINSDTVINEQSVIKATNRVIDFKILSEKQDDLYLTIKISAIVGDDLSKINCKSRSVNITLLKGIHNSTSDVPSKLARYVPTWYNNTYKVIALSLIHI